MTVGLVLVSHSAKIADGLVELARQMAPQVTIAAAGGTDDGRIGTSFDRVVAALTAADDGDGVVVLCDLGSAVLTAETALELLDDDAARDRSRIADAPLVEGAVAAAVAAAAGATLEDVVAAAEGRALDAPSEATSTEARSTDVQGDRDTEAERVATLVNPAGLHARPVATLVRLAASFDARVRIDGVDASSMLQLLALGRDRGHRLAITATGPQAEEAVTAIATLVDEGFGEDA